MAQNTKKPYDWGIWFIVVWLMFPMASGAHGETVSNDANESTGFRGAFNGYFLYGPIEGSLQTPAGGNPGSTSNERPTLDELDIDNASIGDLSLILGWRNHDVYFGAQLVRLSGESMLDRDLISQNNFFPAGSIIESDVKLDWYRIGYRYRITCLRKDSTPVLVLYPSAGFALLDFSLKIDGPGDLAVDRSYAKGSPQLGMQIDWALTQKLSISGQFLGSLPLSNAPVILLGQMVAKYLFLDRSPVSLAGLLGVSYEAIYYEDNQPVPNDIEVDIGPMLTVGLQVGF